MGATGPGRPVDLGGPRRRALLAMLLAARGQVVSTDRLVAWLWGGTPPPGALGALQAYVSHVRRALEPDRAPRTSSAVLRSAPPGYLIVLPSDAVDAWRFEDLVTRAAARADPALAWADLDEALGLWRGPAFAEVAGESWAIAEAVRLEELRTVARELRVAVMLSVGAAADAVLAAEPLTIEQPLREEPWRLLTLALYASGRQGEALAALRRARALLADELGVDPGRALARLEADVLAQRVTAVGAVAGARPAARPPGVAASAAPYVDRPAELRLLQAAADRAVAAPAAGVCLLGGEPGTGKSTLLQVLGRTLTAAGWLVVTGRCPESPGGPPARAWAEIVRALADVVDAGPGGHPAALAPLLQDTPAPASVDPSFGRLVLQRAVRDLLRVATERMPVAVLIDDLHRADSESLALLTGLVGDADGMRLLLVGAHRPGEESDELAGAIAALATHSPTRIRVDGLDLTQATSLVTAVVGTAPDASTVAALVERTGGNAFFLAESARLLGAEGPAVALSAVPDGVREVLRHRIRRLGPAAGEVLRLAAVVGQDVDVEILVHAAAGGTADETAVVDALESGVVAGLLLEPAPGAVRFAHVLARDTLYEDTPGVRRARWHARVADAVAELRPTDVAALAHHRFRSGTAAGARAAITAALAAADQAMARYAPESAVHAYEQALRALDRLAGHEPDPAAERVDLLCRLSRAQLAAGAGIDAADTRTRAIRAAARSRDDILLVQALTVWDLPTPWAARPYGSVDREIVALLDRALALPELPDPARCRLLCALVLEIAGHAQQLAHDAAAEAEALARAVTDPVLVGLALHARAAVLLHESDLSGRLPLAQELLEVGRRPGLAVFALLGREYVAQWAATHADVDTLAEHVEQLAALVRIYRWRQAEGVVGMHRGLLAHLVGDLSAARRHYGAAVDVLRRNGGLDVDSIAAIAFFSVALTAGRLADLEPVVRSFDPIPEQGIDIYAVVLDAAGHRAEAMAARTRNRPVPRDFFRSLLLTIRGVAVARLAAGAPEQMRAEAEQVYEDLGEFRGQIGGAVTGAFALGPVDAVLGDLAAVLGRPADAAAHYAAATELAARCGSGPWQAGVRTRSAVPS